MEVRDNRAFADILRLPIERFELKNAVTLQDAVNKLLLAPEIEIYLDQHHLESPTVYSSPYLWNQEVIRKLSESPNAPKYSQTFTSVTLEEALNLIVRVFPGVWEYRECAGRIKITSDPTGLRRSIENIPRSKRVPAALGEGPANRRLPLKEGKIGS